MLSLWCSQQRLHLFERRLLCAAEQKLLHKLAKEAAQARPVPAVTTNIRQKLFDNTLQGFAAAEERVYKAFPTVSLSSASSARGLSTAGEHAAVPSHVKEAARSSKRKDCMDHFASKKPRHSASSSKMPPKLAFDAAEKLMQDMCASEE